MSNTPPAGAELNDRRSLAIAALLQGKNQEEAGSAAGVTGRTIRAWLQDAVFQRALLEARADLLLEVGGLLHTGCRESVDLLRAVVADESARPHARIAAARTLMTMSFKVGETCDGIGRRIVIQAENAARLAESAARRAEEENRSSPERVHRQDPRGPFDPAAAPGPHDPAAACRSIERAVKQETNRQDRVPLGVDGPFDPTAAPGPHDPAAARRSVERAATHETDRQDPRGPFDPAEARRSVERAAQETDRQDRVPLGVDGPFDPAEAPGPHERAATQETDRQDPGGPFDPAANALQRKQRIGRTLVVRSIPLKPQTSSGIGCPPDRIGIGRPSRSGNSWR